MRGAWYRKPSGLSRAIKHLGAFAGKFANKVDWRFGRPYGVSEGDKNRLAQQAGAGMIILTHTDYNLCNFLIPGFWDHAALVRGPGLVIEAVGTGVRTSSIHALLSHCDRAVLLDPTFATHLIKADAVDRAVSQEGRPYDFDFEYRLDGNKSFYCSELVWWAYDSAMRPGLAPFQPEYQFGQYTLSPQDIFDSESMTTVYETGR